MTDDQARDMFGAALDDGLSRDERASFEAHLSAHPQLAEEFARFRGLFAQAGEVHRAVPVPDLLPGVQKKLRDRSRRDGTAQLRGRGFLTPTTLGLVLIALLGVLWLAFHLMTGLGQP